MPGYCRPGHIVYIYSAVDYAYPSKKIFAKKYVHRDDMHVR